MDVNLRQRLDGLVSGECSLEVFVQELFVLCDATPDSAWEALALVDQYYRRGILPADSFRTVKYRIERHVLGLPDLDAVRELSDGHPATEAQINAARGGAFSTVATPEHPASPEELAGEERARRIKLPYAHPPVHRLRKRPALVSDLGRRTRSALANIQRRLRLWRSQARQSCDRLTSIEWRRFVREHLPGELIRPSLAAAVLATVLLGIESSRAPQDFPQQKQPDTGNTILRTAAAVEIPRISEPGQISLSADRYIVFPGHASAEIEVRRTGSVNGDVSVAWWTQPSAGAKPARDYVSRAPQVALFRNGEETLHFSVPIVANPSRKHTEFFYIVIGKPGDGASLGSITRAAVFIMRPEKMSPFVNETAAITKH